MDRARHHIFTYCHPAVIFTYFVAVIGCTMCTLSPVYVALSFLGGAAYAIYLKGLHSWAKSLGYLVPLFLVITLFNALFNGMGMTVLTSIFGRNITLEALVFGLCSAGMLVSVVQWFSCYQEVMTSEKFLALFGGVVPTIAMMVSMVLRYVPLMSRKASQIQLAQQVSLGTEKPPFSKRIREGSRMASVLMSWSMESSIETADSMNARGYGLREDSTGRHIHRTHFTNERFTVLDGVLLGILALLLIGSVIVIVTVANDLTFYPAFTFPLPAWPAIVLYVVMLVFPLLLEGREQLSWMTSRR